MTAKAATSPNLYRVEQGALRLALHQGQAKAWASPARFTFILAGTQGGKTSFGPWWLWREIQRCGGGDYLAVTSSYDLFKLKFLPELRTVFERVLRIGRFWSGDRIIELRDPKTGEFWAERADDPMWGRIVLRSAAAGGGLESTTAKAALLDECGQDEFTVETWEAVLRRLSLAQGRVLGATTPYNVGWLKTEVYDRWQGGDPAYRVVQFPSFWNPLFPREEFLRAQATMPSWRFRMFYRGQFTKPAGLIYDCFNEKLQAIPDFPIPPHWPRYVGIDFGGANTALVWVAHDLERNRFIVYRESLDGGKSTPDHVRDALQVSARENVLGWYGGAPGETQQRADWDAAGIGVGLPAIPDVEAGIERVYGLLKTRRLFVFESCRGVRDELGSYRRKLDDSGQPTNEIVDKRRYHRLDALRYVAPALTGEAEVEWETW